VTPVEFRGDLWHQKTRVPGLSCGVVCVILSIAVLVEHRLVTDRHRHRPMASTADPKHSAVKICADYRLSVRSQHELQNLNYFGI